MAGVPFADRLAERLMTPRRGLRETAHSLLDVLVVGGWVKGMAAVPIATANLDDKAEDKPLLKVRMPFLRAELERLRADIICLQEIHVQPGDNGATLRALDEVLEGIPYETFNRAYTVGADGEPTRGAISSYSAGCRSVRSARCYTALLLRRTIDR